MTSLSFSQLKHSSPLEASETESISELIYETDRYIYPALFNSRENAIRILSAVLENGHGLFDIGNVYVARQVNEIIGLVLWVDGPLPFNRSEFLSAARRLGSSIDNLDTVAREYFDMYAGVDRDGIISIVNFCVMGNMRNRGIGGQLLSSFIDTRPEATYRLSVLANNHAAIRLYERLGFRAVREYDGFALQEPKPRCLDMCKHPKQ